MNQMDRFDLAKAAIAAQPAMEDTGAAFVQDMDNMLAKHNAYIRDAGTDLPEVNDWQWKGLK